jgi:hypothetical protein
MEVKLGTNSLWKVSLLWNNMTYIQNTNRFQIQIDVSWLVKIQFDRRIDVWNWYLISRKFLTNDALDLIWSPAFSDIYVWLGHCFKAVTLPYLLLIRRLRHVTLEHVNYPPFTYLLVTLWTEVVSACRAMRRAGRANCHHRVTAGTRAERSPRVHCYLCKEIWR